MSDFTIALTTAGAAHLAALIAAEEPLVLTQMAIGDGELGELDPDDLTALISQQDIKNVSGVVHDGTNVSVRGDFTNAGLETGYPVREIGVFAQDPDEGPDVLLAYANAGEAATFMPAAGSTALNLVITTVLVVSGELVVTVTAEAGTYVTLAQWSVHLSGAGGTDQHPLATTEAPGLMSATDKEKLNGLETGAVDLLETYLPLIGYETTGGLHLGAYPAGQPAIFGAHYISIPAGLFLLDVSKFRNILGIYLEAVVSRSSATAIRLYDIDGDAVVTSSEITTSNVTVTRLRSSALTLTGSKTYVLQAKGSNLKIYNARLVIQQGPVA